MSKLSDAMSQMIYYPRLSLSYYFLRILKRKSLHEVRENDKGEKRGEWDTRAAFPFSSPPSSPSSFEQYLKAQKKRNVRQIVCYAQRYHRVLETGDPSALVSLPSGAMRRHAMEAITAYAKYSGLYEKWCQIRKHYSLRWINGEMNHCMLCTVSSMVNHSKAC
jgi:DNA-directed RNA polymerase specialized sigma24 family protein